MASISMASNSLNATAMSIEGDFESTIQNLLTSAAPGLEFLYDTCRQVYPHQPNPLQVTAYIKYWLVVQHFFFCQIPPCCFFAGLIDCL